MPLNSSQIIQRAYREGNLIPIGTEPNTAELTETLGIYQDMVAGFIGNDLGQLLGDWEVPPSPTSQFPSRFPLYPAQTPYNNDGDVWQNPPANVRLLTNEGIPSGRIYFPPTPSNGARMALVNIGADFVTNNLVLDGNGRLIEGAATLTISAALATPILWFYRADLGNWVRVSPLELTTDSPLPENFNRFLICALAINRGGGYNKEPLSTTVAAYEQGLKLLKTTYKQAQNGAPMPGAWRMNSYQSYGTAGQWWGNGFNI